MLINQSINEPFGKISFNLHFLWAEKFINQSKERMIKYEVKEWGVFKNG